MLPHGVSKRILVVDDDQALLGLMAAWLRRAGYEVTTASTFEDAKRELAARTPDVLISDVRLGAFNGLQLVVLTTLTHPAMHAIVLTGYDDPVLREDAAKSGARYLVKPVTAEQLIGQIEESARGMSGGGRRG